MKFARIVFIGAGVWGIVVLMLFLLGILFIVAFTKTRASEPRDA